MKHTKRILATLLTLALVLSLAVPAFADEPFTITVDKKMVATEESITLTAVNAPQVQEGQTVQYQWYFGYEPIHGGSGKLIGTTPDASIQIQAPGKDVVIPTQADPFHQQFSTKYWCVVEISDDSGPVASYTSRRIEVVGYYSLRDSFAVPYEYAVYLFAYMLVPGIVFYTPMILPNTFACLFGILWSPWVAVANANEAKRVNG